ncbi:MAG: aminoglycoside phosphotransferase family protein [Ruminococcus sp.]|nr:aminoglycoside phosphotransferase family protein [Ruminococcus sp.]
MEKILENLKVFGLPDADVKTEKINSGHINSTYKIIYSDGSRYILQRINGDVFNKPEEIMSNTDRICRCLAGKVRCPDFLRCGDRNYIISEGQMWRIYHYIDNSISFTTLDDDAKIYEFGSVVGEFHSLTANLNTDDFYNVIENFHNTSYILEDIIKNKSENYSKEYSFFERMLEYSRKLDEKKLPLNVTHNDVKPSNVLFDKSSNKGITLIDFDTVMPGLIVYDFGDGARSACISENMLDPDKFKSYCKGYFSKAYYEGAENYFLGMLCITAELAARYFRDFLSGGNYFSDKTPDEKLNRCRELIKTAESICGKQEEICGIIQDFQ